MRTPTLLAALLALAPGLSAQDKPPFENPWLDKNLNRVDLARPIPLLTKEGILRPEPFRPAPPSLDRLDLFAGLPGKPGWGEGAAAWVPCLSFPTRITAISHGAYFVGQMFGDIVLVDGASVWHWLAPSGSPAPIAGFPNTDLAQAGGNRVIRADRTGAWIWSDPTTRADVTSLALDGADRLWMTDGLEVQFTSGARGGTPTVVIPLGTPEPFQGGTFRPTLVAADPRIDQVVVASENALYLTDPQTRTLRHFSGIPGGGQALDGPKDQAQFTRITGVAVHLSGWVLVSDGGAGTMRLVSPGGEVTTLQRFGGNGTVFRIVQPGEVLFDGDAALVVDTDQHVVWKIH